MPTSHPRAIAAAVAALAMVALLLIAGPGAAVIDPSVLRDRDVAAEPSAQLTKAERDSLEFAAAQLRIEGTPTKFVVIGRRPGTAAEAQRYAQRVRSAVGRDTVLVLSANPRNLSIASVLPTSQTDRIFDARTPDLRADPVEGTIAVARDIAKQVRLQDSLPSGGNGGGDSGGGGSSVGPLLAILGLGGVAVVGMTVIGRRRARKRIAQAQGEEKAMLDPLVDGLAAQINELDPEVALGNERAQAAKADYQEAVLTYSDARAAVEKARTPGQIGEARAMLEKGLRAARRARAHLDGRPVEEAEQEPLLEGLCTFDPKHGRAVGTATVTAPDGRTAEVPVCAACQERMAQGQNPEIREIEVGGRRRPYWQSGVGGGGSMGGLMNGALLGILLGGMFGGGGAMGQDSPHDGGSGGWPDQWGGGGGGGGDFGGGGGGDGGGGGGGDF